MVTWLQKIEKALEIHWFGSMYHTCYIDSCLCHYQAECLTPLIARGRAAAAAAARLEADSIRQCVLQASSGRTAAQIYDLQ